MDDPRYVTCPGCGRAFKGERGLRSHQSARHLSMDCRPRVPVPAPVVIRTYVHPDHPLPPWPRKD